MFTTSTNGKQQTGNRKHFVTAKSRDANSTQWCPMLGCWDCLRCSATGCEALLVASGTTWWLLYTPVNFSLLDCLTCCYTIDEMFECAMNAHRALWTARWVLLSIAGFRPSKFERLASILSFSRTWRSFILELLNFGQTRTTWWLSSTASHPNLQHWSVGVSSSLS